MKAGDVVRIKTTGEQVYVFGPGKEEGTTIIMRPQLGRDGVKHTEEIWPTGALETIEQNIEREADEQVIRARIGEKISNLLKSQRKQREIDELDEADGPVGPVLLKN